MRLTVKFLCGATCASCILLPHIVLCQTCYYPNGDISKSDYPCSSEVDGLCCPLNWQCLSNGLCYLDNEDYYGRYTCTDRTWSSPGCPEICTDENTDAGDQAVLQCSNHGGNWCCDHNRNASNVCCDSTDSNDFFPLSKGTSVASISTTGPAVASAAIIGNPGNGDTTTSETTTTSSSSSSSSSTSTSSTSTSTSATTSTSTTSKAGGAAAHTSSTSLVSTSSLVSVVTSGANGGLITTTNIIIQTVVPASSPSSPSSSSSSSHLGAEIGGAVAGAVALIGIILLALFLLRRRRKKRRQEQYRSGPMTEDRKSIEYMYKSNNDTTHSPHTAETSPEIDGTPIVGVYRGWSSPPGGEGALRVVNGSERQSTVSSSGGGGASTLNPRDSSALSELESPSTPKRLAAFARGGQAQQQQPATIAEQPYELPGQGRGQEEKF